MVVGNSYFDGMIQIRFFHTILYFTNRGPDWSPCAPGYVLLLKLAIPGARLMIGLRPVARWSTLINFLQIETKIATLTIGNLRNKDATEYTQIVLDPLFFKKNNPQCPKIAADRPRQNTAMVLLRR